MQKTLLYRWLSGLYTAATAHTFIYYFILFSEKSRDQQRIRAQADYRPCFVAPRIIIYRFIYDVGISFPLLIVYKYIYIGAAHWYYLISSVYQFLNGSRKDMSTPNYLYKYSDAPIMLIRRKIAQHSSSQYRSWTCSHQRGDSPDDTVHSWKIYNIEYEESLTRNWK